MYGRSATTPVRQSSAELLSAKLVSLQNDFGVDSYHGLHVIAGQVAASIQSSRRRASGWPPGADAGGRPHAGRLVDPASPAPVRPVLCHGWRLHAALRRPPVGNGHLLIAALIFGCRETTSSPPSSPLSAGAGAAATGAASGATPPASPKSPRCSRRPGGPASRSTASFVGAGGAFAPSSTSAITAGMRTTSAREKRA